MFKQVIVVTDSSRDSSNFIKCLGGLKVYGAEKCLLVQFRSVDEIVDIAKAYNEAILTEYVKTLQNQKDMLEKLGYSVETRILTGFSAKEVNRIAVEENYSAVVVGADKHSSTDELLFSSLANDLIHNALKPILLIRPWEQQGKDRSQPSAESVCCEIGDNVLFPTDFSDNADLAFSFVVEMAANKSKKITLLHVQDKTRISPYLVDRLEEFNEIDNSRLQGMKKILQDKGCAEVEIVVKYGAPSVEILNLVKEKNIQLVIMGTQGRGYVNEFFLGSVSHNIARQATSSVLLIPTKRI